MEESQSVNKQDNSTGEGSPHNEGELKDQTGQLNDTYTTVIPPSTAHSYIRYMHMQ